MTAGESQSMKHEISQHHLNKDFAESVLLNSSRLEQDASHVASLRFVGTTHENSKQCFKMGGVPDLLLGLFHHQRIVGVETMGKTGSVEMGETA
jgi:hypothetical protein